ncbi:hypothetical protein CAEBREN_03275 [Caenorhabditis brenneri]|uniref:Uncharacterized protein n=1 Tax=Caenorhabditis brenneri TaxID=135651 RepID=G0NF71_CAEBE|nr:hypothetical protein CAEBREN_03275 [Caenorhabditis brenneri]
MEDKIDDLNHYFEGRVGPVTISKPSVPPIPYSGHRVSDAFKTLKESIIGDTCHKTGEAFNNPDGDDGHLEAMDDSRKMSESKDM